MDSPNVHDDHQLQQQQFFHGISLDESYGSNYTPTISTSMNQDSFFQQSPHQWHHNFSFDQNHDLMSTELQLSSASLMFPNTTTITRNDHHFNHVFPSTNFSPSSDYGSSLFPRLNLKAFDLFTSTFDSEISSSTRVHQPLHGDSPTGSSNQILSRSNGIISTKRPAHIESKDSNSHTKTKKSKSSMPRSPFPTLKVRKEKLGDRIAALQKLVAPFGKTDTASVLTEAIGYIQFLHDQVQTLTVPYMNSSRNLGLEQEELERDLTSRGLSLVSHDCASFFVRSYNGSSI